MKLTVIGAGNMGGAIIRGWIAAGYQPQDITGVDVCAKTLDSLREAGVNTVSDAAQAVTNADVILLAVKPWLVDSVAEQIKGRINPRAIVGSVAAGVDFARLSSLFGDAFPLFRIIPNTAVTVGESMTFIASLCATDEQKKTMSTLFEPLGKVMEIKEEQVTACTSLASCGIAFAMRYIRASMEGGVEMGIPAQTAQEIVAQTVKGAAEILLQPDTHPEVEIDRVTTPGGITIKGLNAMEKHGFTHAVIEGLKSSK